MNRDIRFTSAPQLKLQVLSGHGAQMIVAHARGASRLRLAATVARFVAQFLLHAQEARPPAIGQAEREVEIERETNIECGALKQGDVTCAGLCFAVSH